jgi:hypothetical protein
MRAPVKSANNRKVHRYITHMMAIDPSQVGSLAKMEKQPCRKSAWTLPPHHVEGKSST